MGIRTNLILATGDDLDLLVEHPKTLDWFLWRPEKSGEPSGYLDKALQYIQAMFDSAALPVKLYPPNTQGSRIRCPGEWCYHYALYPSAVRGVQEAFSATSTEAMVAQYEQAERTPDPSDVQYALAYYEDLQRFVDHAASNGLGFLLNHG